MNISEEELALRREFARQGQSLFLRGYATGAAGNMSMLLPDGTVIATPTGSCLGTLIPEKLSKLSADGSLISGPKATKEARFHLALYRNNPEIRAVVHLHSDYATALSCLDNLNPSSVLRPFTPYVVMRMGDIPLIPYYRPGSEQIASDLAAVAPGHKAFLLANHGLVAGGDNLTQAVNNAEELEATAKLFFILQPLSSHIRYLTENEIKELR